MSNPAAVTVSAPSANAVQAKKIVHVNPLSKKNAFGLASQLGNNTNIAPTTITVPVVAPSTPLSLQMGGITHAVDDLITGYETLVHSLPTISKTVSDMHQGTEAIAKDLQSRTRSLVNEYEYLEGISSQLPELFHQTAEDYKSALLGNTHFVTDKEREMMEGVQKELDRMKVELQSITHERVVVDVLTRPTIKDIQTLRARIPQPIKPSSRVYQTTAGGARQPAEHIPSYSSTSISSSKATESRRATSQIIIPTDPNIPIPVPTYIPMHLRGKKGKSGSGNVTFMDMEAPPQSRAVTARSVGNKVIVPNVRVGDLPEDLRNIRTQPMNTNSNGSKTTKKKRVVSLSSGPISKQLQAKFGETEAELKRLKDQLAKADTRFNKEKSKSMKKLQLIAQMMEEKQLWKDQALLASVDTLIQEAMNSFQDVVDEVDLLRMLEEILQSIPLPDDIYADQFNAPQDYAVVNVTHQPHIPTMAPLPPPMPQPVLHTEYTVLEPSPAVRQADMVDEGVQVSRNMEEAPFREREIQTDLALAPPPPPQHTIIQPQIIVQRDGVEKDFLQLLHTVIHTHQKAMEGQQALILSLITERGQVQQVEDDSEDVSERQAVQEMPTPAPEPIKAATEEPSSILEPEALSVLEAPQPPAPEPVQKPKYNTAFGEVVLGGDYFEAPYQVQPQLNFDTLMAMRGLEGQPAVQPPYDAPHLRRRAAPLTMKYLMNMDQQQPPAAEAPPAALSNEVNVLDFASKLLDAVKPAVPQGVMTKDDILKVINDGISRGVKEAMGYFNQPEPLAATEEPTHKRTLMDRQLKYLDNAFAGEFIGKKDVKTKDSMDSEVIHEEMVKSEAIKHKLIYEEDRYSDGYHDSISLDEGFQARYGRDSFDKLTNRIPYHDVRESIHSDSAESGNAADLVAPRHRDIAKSRRKFAAADSLDSMLSLDPDTSAGGVAGHTQGLLPLCSNVLPQPATSYIRTKLAKDHSKAESRYLQEDSDGEWSLRSDSMDDIHSLELERDQAPHKQKRAVQAARFALQSEHLRDTARKELDDTASTNVSMSSSMSSVASSSLRKPRRHSEEHVKRRGQLANLNAKRASLDSHSSISTPEKDLANSFSTTSSSDFGYYQKPYTASRIQPPKYRSKANNHNSKLTESRSSTYSSEASSYRSYDLSHQRRGGADGEEDTGSQSYADSDVSIDFSISSAGSSAQGMARAPVPLLSVSGRSSARPKWNG